MRKNTKSKPNNADIVNVQLDHFRATAFHEMMDVTGLTQSELLREIVNPVIDAYIYNVKKKCSDIQKQAAFEMIKHNREGNLVKDIHRNAEDHGHE